MKKNYLSSPPSSLSFPWKRGPACQRLSAAMAGRSRQNILASLLLAATLAVFFGPTLVSAQEQTVSCCIFFPKDGGGALACGESKPRDRGDDERLRLASEKCDKSKNEFRATKDVRFVGSVAGSSCRASPACAEPVPIAPLAEPDPTPPAAPAADWSLTLPEIKFRPPLLSIPIPGIPDFSNVKLQGPEGQRYYLIPWLAQYLEAVYRYALSIIGVIATVMVVYGGVKWLVAAGDSGKITEAKKTITEAVIGLVIALGSYLILFTINPEIVKFRALQVAFIEQQSLDYAVFTTNEDTRPEEDRLRDASGPVSTFENCPVSLIKNPTKTSPREPRTAEFIQKIPAVITGTTPREKVVQISQAAAKCGLHMGSCGKTGQTIYEIAGVPSSKSGLGRQTKTIGGPRVNYLTGLVRNCNASSDKAACRGKAIRDAYQKFRQEIPGYPDAWADQLRPGDVYWTFTAHKDGAGQHTAIFMGWGGGGKTKAVQGAFQTLVKESSHCIKSSCPNPLPLTQIFSVE